MGRKGLLLKTLDRCRSLGGGQRKEGGKRCVAPEGCLSVYVGPERERFVVRTEWLNHPLFRALLEEAEAAFGYATEGPLELPCNVGLFHRVLWEITDVDREVAAGSLGCSSFARSPAPFGGGGIRSPGGGRAGYRLLIDPAVQAVMAGP